ncbi:hypothetical protein ABZU76_27210 [Amycolatopsis sp. NPDC005232]|uniref:cupin domain-containing protein n=1 Tax=Amycolatopsis sp. NPDC005232 TaxID=3157027 RepID=UPI0033A6F5D1
MTPIDLFTSFLYLHDDGHAAAAPRTFDGEPDDWHLMTFRATTDADVHSDHWEIHAAADEIVCCLTGGFRLYLRDDDTPATLTPGTAAIVPCGRWHRLELDAPGDLLSVTVPRGTRIEPRAA